MPLTGSSLAHQERVSSLAYRMLGNPEDAADVQQETFVQAWRNLRKFRQDAALPTWLHRIAVNLCLSRKRRRQTKPLEPYMEDTLPSAEPSGVACLARAETTQVVRRAIAALPAHHRALISTWEIEDRPLRREIAQILGCSVQSARTRLTKARKLLRGETGALPRQRRPMSNRHEDKDWQRVSRLLRDADLVPGHTGLPWRK